MTPTEELRRLLNERGVEYEVDDAKTVRVTRWRAYGDWVSFIEYDNGDTKFCIDARRLTPAQAVEATLGRGTCHDLGGVGASGKDVFNCDKCGCVLSLYDRDGLNNLCTSFIYDYPRYCPECGRRVVDE